MCIRDRYYVRMNICVRNVGRHGGGWNWLKCEKAKHLGWKLRRQGRMQTSIKKMKSATFVHVFVCIIHSGYHTHTCIYKYITAWQKQYNQPDDRQEIINFLQMQPYLAATQYFCFMTFLPLPTKYSADNELNLRLTESETRYYFSNDVIAL